MLKGILYYTDNQLDNKLAETVRKYISASGLPITSVTLEPMNFGRNIVLGGEKSYMTMNKQILFGLENMEEDIVYLAEHDVLYHLSHFKYTPVDEDTFYYNGNYWMLRLEDGYSIHYDILPMSGLVAYRKSLLTHFKERVEAIYLRGYVGTEPMLRDRGEWKNVFKVEVFNPPCPNVDIVHGGNLIRRFWRHASLAKKTKYWDQSWGYSVPGWDLEEIIP
jgi:hypothetical protein